MLKAVRKAFVAVVAAGMLAAAAITPAAAHPVGGFHGGGFPGGGFGHYHGVPMGPGPALHGGLHGPVAPHWHGNPGGPGWHGGGRYGPHWHGNPPPPYRPVGPYPGPYFGPVYGGPYGPYGPGWYGGPYWSNWGPAITFGAGALIGGGVAAAASSGDVAPVQAGINPKHYQWCEDHYKSYRASDNTYQPNSGPRKECTSPYY